jgi:hypothetical protein
MILGLFPESYCPTELYDCKNLNEKVGGFQRLRSFEQPQHYVVVSASVQSVGNSRNQPFFSSQTLNSAHITQ